MAEDKITFEDVKEYEGLFSIAPSFLLEVISSPQIKGINYLSFLILKYPICRRLWQNHTKKPIKNSSNY